MPRPFGDDDYAEPRSYDQVTADLPKVQLQVSGLLRFAQDAEYAAEFVGRLQQRRAGSAAVPIEPVQRADGQTVYVAGGQAVVHGPDRGAGVSLRLADPGASPRAADSPGSARELVDRLRGEGQRADFNYLVPLGGIVLKAEGGPENTAGRRPFPAVQYRSKGRPASVAVIDTGVSLELRTDGYLQGLVRADNVDALDALPFPTADGLLDAEAGHGAFVTGIVQQVAPTARVRVYKVTGPDGLCTDLQLADAIRRAATDGADLINLSLGTATLDDTPPPAMTAAIADVLAANDHLVIVVAAGNDGDNGVPIWPAALSGTGPAGQTFGRVVAVAAVNPDESPSDFSSRGEWVTISTVGRGVLSTYVIGTENGELINDPDPDTFGADAWAVWTGSSFAAPQVTGALARRCDEFAESPPEALKKLVNGIPRTPEWGHVMTILPGT
jgi:hypothetical protein